MGYEGGDLLLTALPGQHPGRCPGLCAQAVGGGLGGRAAVVSDVMCALEVAGSHEMRYTNRRLTFTFLPLHRNAMPPGDCTCSVWPAPMQQRSPVPDP